MKRFLVFSFSVVLFLLSSQSLVFAETVQSETCQDYDCCSDIINHPISGAQSDDDYAEGLQEDCYFALSRSLNDIDYCELIIDEPYYGKYEQCLDPPDEEGIDFCYTSDSSEVTNTCIYEAATEYALWDHDLCQKIDDADLRRECRQNYAKYWNRFLFDPSVEYFLVSIIIIALSIFFYRRQRGKGEAEKALSKKLMLWLISFQISIQYLPIMIPSFMIYYLKSTRVFFAYNWQFYSFVNLALVLLIYGLFKLFLKRSSVNMASARVNFVLILMIIFYLLAWIMTCDNCFV